MAETQDLAQVQQYIAGLGGELHLLQRDLGVLPDPEHPALGRGAVRQHHVRRLIATVAPPGAKPLLYTMAVICYISAPD